MRDRRPPSARRLALGASLLTAATAAHKLALFVMKARIGQLGGAETLGLATSVLTLTWMIAAVSHLGIADHAMVRAAIAAEQSDGRARHGLFLGTAALAGALALALATAGHGRPDLAALLVVGAIAQHAAGVALLTLRGLARPRLETMTLFAAATCLVAGSWLATDPVGVVACYALQGVVFLIALAAGTAILPSLRPRWPEAAAALAEVKQSLPIFVVGVSALFLGSTDVLATQLVLGEASVGELTCATLVVRTGLQVPWLVGTLALAHLHRARPGAPRLLGGVTAAGGALALGGALAAYLSRDLVSRALGVPLATFEDALGRAIVLAPASYVAILALPIAMTIALGRTVRATLFAFALTVVATVALGAALGLAGVQLGHAAGHLVLAVGLLAALARAPRAGDQPAARASSTA